MIIAVLGAGAGGLSAVAELAQRGHRARLWNRSAGTVDACREAGVSYEGVLGTGTVRPELVTTDLAAAVDGADVLLVCLPTLAHAALAGMLAALAVDRIPVVLDPGHTGGALEFAQAYARAGVSPPPIAELSTLTYVARKSAPCAVRTTGVAKRVWAAALPDGQAALDATAELYPCVRRARDVLASGLCNVNMVLHPPGAILAAAWIEASGGDFTFYVEGLTDGVGRVMEALDRERLAVGAAYGHTLPTLFEEMQAIGTIEAGADPQRGLAAAVRAGKANRQIKAPHSLAHRYYREDFWYGLMPFTVFADIAGVPVPIAASLLHLAQTLLEPTERPEGRSAASMGIDGLDKGGLLERLRGPGGR